FPHTTEPGLYTWRQADRPDVIGVAQVHLPSAEADLTYRAPDSVLPPAENVLVASSLPELRSRITEISEPSPRWSWAIALVLFLMCLEALMASVSRLWNPTPLRNFIPRLVKT